MMPQSEVVNRLITEFPNVALRLVVDARLAGPNRKAANLANIARAARYDLYLLADSDVRVDQDCIASTVAPSRTALSARSHRSTRAGQPKRRHPNSARSI